ncbi:MAG TPA: XdhC family protein, partial [Herpetosiphonaceae bacterium]
MREILEAIERWHGAGEQVALATVVRIYGSAPRAAGAKLAVSGSGALVGSVSGGCVEGAVADACLRALKSGQFSVLDFGISDEQAWDVGLACGGTIAVSIEPLAADGLRFWVEQAPALAAAD